MLRAGSADAAVMAPASASAVAVASTLRTPSRPSPPPLPSPARRDGLPTAITRAVTIPGPLVGGLAPIARDQRRLTDPPPESRLRMIAAEHNRRKELERLELIEMILESIASVPLAVEKLHTNERLRAALEQEIGEEHAILHRLFVNSPKASMAPLRANGTTQAWPISHSQASVSPVEGPLVGDQRRPDPHGRSNHYSERGNDREDDEDDDVNVEDDEDEDDESSYDSEYEKDLAEAVNQLVMSDASLDRVERQLSSPIGIDNRGADQSSLRTSNSPQSSVFGASPGTYSQDGEPVSALWPRQPHQFAFTQEEEEEETASRAHDEVYSEMVSSVCEDESIQEEDGDADDGPFLVDMEKVFIMDDHEDGDMNEYISGPRRSLIADTNLPTMSLVEEGDEGASTPRLSEAGRVVEDASNLGDQDDGDYDCDVFDLRIIRQKNRTGFEPSADWRPRVGSVVGGRYKVQLEIGEAVFSRTYKCLDLDTEQVVCLKIIKNSKEYFDQGIDEIRVLQFIGDHCDVDEKHLVQLFDYFYFKEHLVIVTELLRDNLYEFSKLLMERGNINYFSIPRLKKIAIEVLEALGFLHSLGLMHCDLKPENILISNFNDCQIKVIDFGSACFVTDELTTYVQSRSYRAPEVILGLSYDQKIDMWSLGCVLAELFAGEVLFKNDSEQSLLERIIAIIGPIPADLLAESGELLVQFTENPSFRLDASGNGVLSSSSKDRPTLEALLQTSDIEFVDFLRRLLTIHPQERLGAAEALAHPWLQHGVFSRNV